MTAYAVSKAQPRARKELYTKRAKLLQELAQAFESGKEVRP
jgi:deoxyhypusine synthase